MSIGFNMIKLKKVNSLGLIDIMTPAINLLRQQGVAHQIHAYEHDRDAVSYGIEASEKLGVDPEQVFKTLVVCIDGKELAVAIIPVCERLSMKQIAKTLHGKKADMANPLQVQKSTGYVLGGVSPLGQKKQLSTVIDHSAKDLEQIYISAGRRGLEISLSTDVLQQLTHAVFADLTGKGVL